MDPVKNESDIAVILSQLAGSPSDTIPQRVRDWIASLPSDLSRLDTIVALFGFVESNQEHADIVVGTAWDLLLERRLWTSRFATEAEAMSSLDQPWLRDLRQRLSVRPDRKGALIQKIKLRWGTATDDWSLDKMGEHHLGNVAAAARSYEFDEALGLAARAALIRIRAGTVGRGVSRRISTGDWTSVCSTAPDVVDKLWAEPLTGADIDFLHGLAPGMAEQLRHVRPLSTRDPDTTSSPAKRPRLSFVGGDRLDHLSPPSSPLRLTQLSPPITPTHSNHPSPPSTPSRLSYQSSPPILGRQEAVGSGSSSTHVSAYSFVAFIFNTNGSLETIDRDRNRRSPHTRTSAGR